MVRNPANLRNVSSFCPFLNSYTPQTYQKSHNACVFGSHLKLKRRRISLERILDIHLL